MIDSRLREKLLKWKDWETQRGSLVAQEVDKLIHRLSQPCDLFWTGEAVQSGLLLDTLLSMDLFTKIGLSVEGIKFRIQYGANKAFKAFFQNDQPRIINDQAFQLLLKEQDGPWKKARNQLKEIIITLPNDVLRSASIVYSPWNHYEEPTNFPDLSKYPWAFIAIGGQSLSDNQITYLRSILEQPRVHTWVEGRYPFFENEYIYEEIDFENISVIGDALREKQHLSSYQANLFYDFISQPMTKLYDEIYPFYENTIEPIHQAFQGLLLQDEQLSESQKKYHQWMDDHYQLRKILREWNKLNVKDISSLLKALEEIGLLANKMGVHENYVELMEEWDQIVYPQYKAYHQSFSTYFHDTKKQRKELEYLSFRWSSVKRVFGFLSKIKNYSVEVEAYNENGKRLDREANRIENTQQEIQEVFQHFQTKVKELLHVLDNELLKKMKSQRQKYEQWLQRRLNNMKLNEEMVDGVLTKIKLWKTSLSYIDQLLQFYEYKEGAYFENTWNLYENLQEITKTEQLKVGRERLGSLYRQKQYPNLNESLDGPSIQLKECNIPIKKYLSRRINMNLQAYIEMLRRRRNKVAAILVLGITFWVGTFILEDEKAYSNFSDEEYSEATDPLYTPEDNNVNEEQQDSSAVEEAPKATVIFQVDEERLSQFLYDFRNDYMSALNDKDFSRIAPYLLDQGHAYNELASYISSLTDNGYHFEFYDLSINRIEEVGGNRYKVHVYETFDFMSSEDPVTFYERDKSYTIQALSEKDLAIEKIDITSTKKEEMVINQEDMVSDEELVMNKVNETVMEEKVEPTITEPDILSFMNRYYADYVMAYNGDGFEKVAWAYDMNSEEVQKVETTIQDVNETGVIVNNESLEIKGFEYNGVSYDVVVTLVNQYVETDGSMNKKKFDEHYRVKEAEGSFDIEEIVGASYGYPEFNE